MWRHRSDNLSLTLVGYDKIKANSDKALWPGKSMYLYPGQVQESVGSGHLSVTAE